MKLVSYKIHGVPPISQFEVTELSDIVVLAGPNGVGKTNLLTSLLGVFQDPGAMPSPVAVVLATNRNEEEKWGQKTLSTAVPAEADKLRAFLQRNQKRGAIAERRHQLRLRATARADQAVRIFVGLPRPFL